MTDESAIDRLTRKRAKAFKKLGLVGPQYAPTELLSLYQVADGKDIVQHHHKWAEWLAWRHRDALSRNGYEKLVPESEPTNYPGDLPPEPD